MGTNSFKYNFKEAIYSEYQVGENAEEALFFFVGVRLYQSIATLVKSNNDSFC
jgi:hypothetical protein